MADERKRRLVHLGGSVVPMAYVLDTHLGPDVLAWWHVRVVLVAGLALAVVLEYLRLVRGLEWRLFDELTREYERDSVAGYALYVVGGTAVGLAFDPQIAVPAMLMLTVGDPISGVLGSNELRPVKGTYVLLTMFGVCTLLAVPFVPAVAAVLGGVAATVADGVKPVVHGYVVDDNLTIPVAGALAMWIGIAVL